MYTRRSSRNRQDRPGRIRCLRSVLWASGRLRLSLTRGDKENRAAGRPARMLPGISAEDCLYADLGVDPGATGCQSYEATDLLVFKRHIDTSAALILWQVGVIGELRVTATPRHDNLPTLVEYLRDFYDADQPIVIYEAPTYSVCDPIIVETALGELAGERHRSFDSLHSSGSRTCRRSGDASQTRTRHCLSHCNQDSRPTSLGRMFNPLRGPTRRSDGRLHTREVAGSIPAAPIRKCLQIMLLRLQIGRDS